ncbi:MAG: peptidase signal peptidase [Frankiales bacterium]|nr:peptidase signal peptidase [Frankiales bacterium]
MGITQLTGAARQLVQSIVIGLCAVVGSLVLISVVPALFGWRSVNVLSGSMAPRIHPGDVIAVAHIVPAELHPGQVVLVRERADGDRMVMHRFVRFTPTGDLITKGDANREVDSSPVPPQDLLGLPRLRVPWIGLPAIWWRAHQTLPLALLASGAGIAGAITLGADGVTARHRRAI